jgi:hypothetical protein
MDQRDQMDPKDPPDQGYPKAQRDHQEQLLKEKETTNRTVMELVVRLH